MNPGFLGGGVGWGAGWTLTIGGSLGVQILSFSCSFLQNNCKQECIPVGCVPSACCPYLPSMHCSQVGVPGPGGYLVPGGCTWSWGMYLVPGGVPGPGGCTWSRRWGVPGPGGGVYLVPGGCTWSQRVYLVPGGYLVLGGVPGPRGVYLVPVECTWSRGSVPGPREGGTWSQGGVPGPGGGTCPGIPPCEQNS